MNVTATGTWRPRAKARSSAEAWRRRTPLPARTSGRCASAMSVGGVGDRLVGRLGEVVLRRRQRRSASSTGIAAMFSGSSTWVGPGFSSVATRNALRDDLGDRLGRSTRVVPLRHRLEHPDDVDDLVGLLVELVERGLAGDRDHRRAVEVGVGDAGNEVRRARPERRHRHGAAAGEAAVDVGHERGALLVAGRDVAGPRWSLSALEDVHRLLARHREDVLAALRREAVDEEVRGGPPGRGAHPPESTRPEFPPTSPVSRSTRPRVPPGRPPRPRHRAMR